MSLLSYFPGHIPGCVGAHIDSGIVLEMSDGSSRLATAEETKAAQVYVMTERIKAERDHRKSAGCPVGQYVFHSDADSRIQQLGLVMLGASIPAGLKWKTMSGVFVDMTPTLAQQIFGAQAARDAGLFAVAESHIVAVKASEDPMSYDFSKGWPA